MAPDQMIARAHHESAMQVQPRWQAIESELLAVGAKGYERSEVSGVRSREGGGRHVRAAQSLIWLSSVN